MKRIQAGAFALLASGVLAGCAGQSVVPSATLAPSSTSTAVSNGSGPAMSGLPTSSTSGITSAPAPGRPLTSVPPAPSTSVPTPSTAVTPTSEPPAHIPTSGTPAPGARLTLRGTVEEGVEHGCLVLTDRTTGRRFNLTAGKPAIVKVGAQISVVGVIRTDLMSYCQQGPIFQVLTATPTK